MAEIIECLLFFKSLFEWYKEVKKQRGEQSMSEFKLSVDTAVAMSKKATTPEEKLAACDLLIQVERNL